MATGTGLMSTRAKIAIVVLLIIIVVLAVWQFTSPSIIPPTGSKYAINQIYSNRGSWAIPENLSYAKIYLVFSIANLTYPRTTLPTDYSIVISNANQTLTNSLVKGIGLRITSLSIQDNYDGSVSKWGVGNGLNDAVQATGTFNFKTSALHQLRFSIGFQLYDLLQVGSLPDKTLTNSFNVTQNVI